MPSACVSRTAVTDTTGLCHYWGPKNVDKIFELVSNKPLKANLSLLPDCAYWTLSSGDLIFSPSQSRWFLTACSATKINLSRIWKEGSPCQAEDSADASLVAWNEKLANARTDCLQEPSKSLWISCCLACCLLFAPCTLDFISRQGFFLFFVLFGYSFQGLNFGFTYNFILIWYHCSNRVSVDNR